MLCGVIQIMDFIKLVENIYEDENFSVSRLGGITVYGNTDMESISRVLLKKFPEKVKVSVNKDGVKFIDMSGLNDT